MLSYGYFFGRSAAALRFSVMRSRSFTFWLEQKIRGCLPAKKIIDFCIYFTGIFRLSGISG
jgi:hypothetical protein